MIVRPFHPQDLEEVNRWNKLHGVEQICLENLPFYGFICNDVAVSFLYRTDSRMVCLMEGVVFNPKASPEDRQEATGLIIEEICRIAEKEGFRKIVGFTKSASVVNRGLLHGFKKVGDVAMLEKFLGDSWAA